KNYFIPDLSKIHSYFEIEGDLVAPGRKMLMKIDDWGSKKFSRLPLGTAIEDLGESGNPETEFLSVVKQFDLPLTFPNNVLKDVRTLNPPEPKAEGRRKDFTDILTFTIDPITAKDFDDAISIKKVEDGYELYVHIADVAEYAELHTSFFKEASKRGNSFYFPKNVIPMLPEILSNRICSLRPGELKNVVSCYFKLDFDGKIVNQYIAEGVINSDYRFSYEDVDKFFEGDDVSFSPGLDEALLGFRELSEVLLKARVTQGYLRLDLPEENFTFDDDGAISNIYLEHETVSHQMIENAMLLANELVAKRLKKSVPDSIYRVHDAPAEDRIEKLKMTLAAYNIKFVPNSKLNISLQGVLEQVDEIDMHDVFDMMVLRSMKRASYTTESTPHFGLAISTYTHFTSPIRRFSDLIVHHQIKAILNSEKETGFTKPQLKFYADSCTQQENLADEAEREITKRLTRAYMKKFIGEILEGKVIELTKTKVILKLKTIPVRVVLETMYLKDGPFELDYRYYCLRQDRGSKVIRLGDTMYAKIDRVTDEVYMQQVREQDIEKLPSDTENDQVAEKVFNNNDPRNPDFTKQATAAYRSKSYDGPKRNRYKDKNRDPRGGKFNDRGRTSGRPSNRGKKK
ncbi:MAG: VacB/RNase II family 3'-5' exoribonuclease, partial [Candidatus Zophobacter franzmannii]|nr:VacB/RNase II family 3'-5' exoribonuclease [Candidatus Zophobacter franzmannii]